MQPRATAEEFKVTRVAVSLSGRLCPKVAGDIPASGQRSGAESGIQGGHSQNPPPHPGG